MLKGIQAVTALVLKSPGLADLHMQSLCTWMKSDHLIALLCQLLQASAQLFMRFPWIPVFDEDIAQLLAVLERVGGALDVSVKFCLVVLLCRCADDLEGLLTSKEDLLNNVFKLLRPKQQARVTMEIVLRARASHTTLAMYIEGFTAVLVASGHYAYCVKLAEVAIGSPQICSSIASQVVKSLVVDLNQDKHRRLLAVVSRISPDVVALHTEKIVTFVCNEERDLKSIDPLLAALFAATLLTNGDMPEATARQLLGFLMKRNRAVDSYNVMRLASLHGAPGFAYKCSYLVRLHTEKFTSVDTTWLGHLQFLCACNSTVSKHIQQYLSYSRQQKRTAGSNVLEDDGTSEAKVGMLDTLASCSRRITCYVARMQGEQCAHLAQLLEAKAALWDAVARSPSLSCPWRILCAPFRDVFGRSPRLLQRLLRHLRACDTRLSSTFLHEFNACTLSATLHLTSSDSDSQATAESRDVLTLLLVEARTNFVLR